MSDKVLFKVNIVRNPKTKHYLDQSTQHNLQILITRLTKLYLEQKRRVKVEL